MKSTLIRPVFWLAFLMAFNAVGGVVINEIFYHAPDDLDDLQWIELHNPDSAPVNVSGWKVTRGVEFTFPADSVVAPGGFVVLCKDAMLFADYYAAKPVGTFKKSLGRGGDTLELVNAQGTTVDRVAFRDRDPWPSSADGVSSSLERICPTSPGDGVENWSASPLPEHREEPAGTPGQTNASFAPNLPPVIGEMTLTPSVPVAGEPIRVRVIVKDPDGVAAVELRYRKVGPGIVGEETVIPMKASTGDEYLGEIPGLDPLQLVRLRVRAVDRHTSERFLPSPHALRPAVSLFVPAVVEKSGISQVFMVNTDPHELAEMERLRLHSLKPNEGSRGNSEQRQLQELLRSGLDLPAAWYELTINQTPDDATCRRLREIFLAAQAARNRLIEESLAAPDLAREIEAVPARIRSLQATVAEQVKGALPPDGAAKFDAWLGKQQEGGGGNGGRFFRRRLNVEGAWLGVNLRAEFTAEQMAALRPVVRTAIEDSGNAVKAATGPQMDFAKLQQRLGEVLETLDGELRRRMTRRQWHALVDWRGSQASPIRPRLVDPPPRSPRGRTAFVVVSPESSGVEVFDFLHITERSAGYKVRFHKDHPWREMTSAAVIFEYNDRFVLAEPLAFDLYRRVGNAACQTDFVRLNMNGHAMGYQLVVEQVNSGFLRRNHLDPSGDLFKILWYGSGVAGQHEKQNHPDRSHKDLLKLVAALNTTQGAAQWELIQKNFDVEQVATYFAVNLVLSHWDGFFNNYFTYQDRKGDGKWRMFPWDQDKTWGFFDSMKDGVFFAMPVTFGMAGDLPPGGGAPRFTPGSWWRPGGHFSQPLLANPEFRKVYLRRVRQILEETYTEKDFFPVIDGMAARLRPEIPIRAGVIGEDPAVALARLDGNVTSLKEHLVKRREFLLKQDEIVNLPR